MQYIKPVLISLFLMFTISGCSIKGHAFKPDFNTINEVKDSSLKPMAIDKKTVDNEKDEKIGLRAANMISPYGGSFSKYLEIALEEELKQASLYNDESAIKISAVFVKNDVSVSSFSIGTADLSANFTVTVDGKKVYEKVHTIHHEWESSFVGQIAIENAIDNYPVAIQKLIDSFLLDKELMEATK